jgi:hypothetical protein
MNETNKILYPSQLEKNITPTYNNTRGELHVHCSSILLSIKSIERTLKENIKRDNEKICPICLETIGETNYVMPICGHPLCVQCFVKNMTKNKQTGHMCGQCREIII